VTHTLSEPKIKAADTTHAAASAALPTIRESFSPLSVSALYLLLQISYQPNDLFSHQNVTNDNWAR
jgi:hypothetical protein